MTFIGFKEDDPTARERAERLEEIFAARQVAKIRVKQLDLELRNVHLNHELDHEALDHLQAAIVTIVDQTSDSIAALATSSEFDVVAKLRERMIHDSDLAGEA